MNLHYKPFPYSVSRTIVAVLTLLCIDALFYSCSTRVDYAKRGEFRYYNRLGAPVNVFIKGGINKPYESYTIAPGDSMVLRTTDMGSKVAYPEQYIPGITADTTTIQFNDTLCYNEFDRRGVVLHNIGRYTFLRRGDADFVFYFSIDSNLVTFAKSCL